MSKMAKVTFQGVSPLSFSRNYREDPGYEKREGELEDAYEKRTWRGRLHVNRDGNVFIPPSMFDNSIRYAAKFAGIKVPGKGNNLFTKYFETGVIVTNCVDLPIKADEVEGERLHVPSDGTRGGARRVFKTFPLIYEWGGTIEVQIWNDEITEEVFRKVIETSGKSIGIGRFRPQTRGYYGRFAVTNLEWEENA